MDFESVDRYLLDGTPAKPAVVEQLLRMPEPPEVARPFLEGLRILGPRTPDLALIALRLALAGRPHDDAAVMAMRSLVERSRKGDVQARDAYARELATAS